MINVKVWGVFHDGDIVSVSGAYPGDIDICIELEYIRRQFPDPGKTFRMHIAACDMLLFEPFGTNEVFEGVSAIAGRDLEILSAKLDNDILHVVTGGGLLRIRYSSDALFLDSGRALHFSELAAAADRAVFLVKKPGI